MQILLIGEGQEALSLPEVVLLTQETGTGFKMTPLPVPLKPGIQFTAPREIGEESARVGFAGEREQK